MSNFRLFSPVFTRKILISKIEFRKIFRTKDLGYAVTPFLSLAVGPWSLAEKPGSPPEICEAHNQVLGLNSPRSRPLEHIFAWTG